MVSMSHGGDLTGYCRRFPDLQPLDFSASLNPLGIPAPVRAAMHAAVEDCARYPDPYCRALTEGLAARWGLAPARIFCANGAAELFYRLAAVLRPKTALLTAPSFGEYENALVQCGCEVRFHSLRREDAFAVTGRILRDITPEVDAVFLCTPNNPTGQVIPSALLDEIAVRCRAAGAWLIVDECFSGFLPGDRARSMRRRLDSDDRLVVVRAFTKLYALAGVRLGWCMGDKALMEKLYEAGQPWGVSHIAQAAGLAALGCGDYVRETVALTERERAFLAAGLSDAGFWVCPGQANFVLFDAKDAALGERLLPQGVILRDCAGFRGLKAGYFRAAVRKREENERLLEKLREVLHG